MDPVLAAVVIMAILGLVIVAIVSLLAYLARDGGPEGIAKVVRSTEGIVHDVTGMSGRAVHDIVGGREAVGGDSMPESPPTGVPKVPDVQDGDKSSDWTPPGV
jgi:hypothetical protein